MENSARGRASAPVDDPRKEDYWQPGAGSPINYLIACFADRAAADAAVRRLIDAGFARDATLILDGPPAYEALLRAEQDDARYRCALAFEELFTDPRIQRGAYYEELRQGRTVILVHAPGAESKERALGIVKRAGGNHLSYRGRWLHEQIP
jgi:hypothetical protein